MDIVAGGSQEIGEACAWRLATQGARVMLVDIDDLKGQALTKKSFKPLT